MSSSAFLSNIANVPTYRFKSMCPCGSMQIQVSLRKDKYKKPKNKKFRRKN